MLLLLAAATLPAGALGFETRISADWIGGMGSLHAAPFSVHIGTDRLFFGTDLVQTSLFLDRKLLQDYGFDWTGAISGPLLASAAAVLNHYQTPAWLRSSVLAASLVPLAASLFSPRFELALAPHLRLSLGARTNLFVWQHAALVTHPYLGLLLSSNPQRGVFSKTRSAAYSPGWSVELRASARWVPWASQAEHGIPEGFGLGVALFKDW